MDWLALPAVLLFRATKPKTAGLLGENQVVFVGFVAEQTGVT